MHCIVVALVLTFCQGQIIDAASDHLVVTQAANVQTFFPVFFLESGTLALFESRGIDCKFEGNEEYEYADNPGYMVSGGWSGQCIGFRNIPNTINCGAGGNVDFRRLCPCKTTW